MQHLLHREQTVIFVSWHRWWGEHQSRLRELAQARPRFGYLRLQTMLRREGWVVNKKRVQRIYREEGLMVRTPRRRKRASHLRILPSQRNGETAGVWILWRIRCWMDGGFVR